MSNADFDAFFAGEFQRLLERTTIPGMGEASWDRRAAWLLWRAMHPGPTPNLEMIKIDEDVYALPLDNAGVFD